MTGKFN